MPIIIPTNLANKVVEKIDVLKAKSRYICCFKGIVEEFEKKEAELFAKEETIVKSIDDAKNKEIIIRDDVMEWVRQCKSLIEEDHTEKTKPCSLGLYPNCIWRYRRGKQLAQKTNEIIRLISVAAAFENVEQRHHPFLSREDEEWISCKDFIYFESRNLIFKQLLDALEDVENYMTALCGMRGTGKTSLALEMGVKLLELKKIDHVIYIDLVEYSNIKIQKAIADKLGLFFGDKNERERSQILWKRLMNGERILIILDDVEKLINFEEIGIPCRDYHMNCRILIISENKNLCKSMGCPRPIQLGLLSEQDSWMLFQKTAGINDRSDIALQKMGQEIAKECEGLPLAIKAICNRLEGVPLLYWEAILIKLRGSIHFVYDSFVWRSAYEMIGKEAQKLSLILSLFPKGTKVPIEILTRFCIGLGLLEDVEKLSDARRRVLEVKDILIDSLLLLEADGGHVQINGLFRKLALSQDLPDIQVIKMCDMNQNAVATKENTIRYLYCDDLLVRDMDFFLNWFDSPKLELLLINIEASDYVEVPEAFFEKMARLRVLFLSSNKPQLKLALQLPLSVQSLTSIRSFFLCHWKLSDISILGKLQSLETLDLDNCSIYELPKEITRLEKLRLLSLKLCEIERNNPFEVIKGCLSLEELYFKDNKLSTINNVNEIKAVNQSGTFPTLNRYHLQGGEDSISKCVCLPRIDAMISEAAFQYLIRGAEILHLKEIKGAWRNLMPDIVPMEDDQGMKDVVDLSLESCSEVKCLINTKHIESTVLSVFSKLVALKLASMDNLEELCSGPVPSKFLKCLKTLGIKECRNLQGILLKGELSLCNLKSLEIFDCPMLTSLFQMSTAQSLVVLEELRIRDCSSLTNIIREDNDHKIYGLIFPKLKILEMKMCQQLQCIPEIVLMEDDQGMKDVVDLSLESCSKVECLINTKHIESTVLSVFSKLVTLKLAGMDTLEELCSGPIPSKFLKCLKTLTIKDCRNLKGILLKGELSLCNLKSLEILDCPMLTSLFQMSTTKSLVVLEELRIWNCSSLTIIIREDSDHKSYDLIFPKLKTLEMKRCQQLQCILPIVFPRGVPLLETIKIDDCGQLRHIFGQYQQEDQDTTLGLLELSERMSNCFNISLESVKRSSPRIGFKAKQQARDSSLSFISNSKSPRPVGSAQWLPEKSPRELNILVVRNVRQLVLYSLDRTKYLFTLSTASSMMLEILKIEWCSHLEHIIDIGDGGDRKNCDVVFPKLKELQVIYCYKLECMFGEYPLDHQNYSDIPIHLPALEKLILHHLPKFSLLLMRWPPLKEFNLYGCPNFINSNSISDMMIHLDSRKPVSKTIKDINEINNLFCTLTNLTIQSHDVYSIFCLDRVQIRGQVRLGLQDLKLHEVHKMSYICVGSRNSFIFQNLKTIRILQCSSLQVIFPACVLSCLPELEHLEIVACTELKQIIEVEDSPQPCFPKLAVLVIFNCTKLKSLIPASYDVPKLELLIIIGALELKVIVGKVKAELPKLKLVILNDLPSLRQELNNELQSVSHRVVHKCPKLSLTSTPTLQEIELEARKFRRGIIWDLDYFLAMAKEIIQSDVVSIIEHIQVKKPNEEATADLIVDPAAQTVSGFALPSSQSEIKFSQSETYTDKEDGDDSVSTSKHSSNKDNLVVKVLADLEKYLKMPLKDLTSSKANSLGLLTALNFLSHLPPEDVSLSDELKEIIHSLHNEFLSIFRSFKKAFATTDKFAVLEGTEKPIKGESAHQSPDSEIFKAEKFIDEAEQKEAILKKQIHRLENEMQVLHNIKRGIEEGATSNNAIIETSSTHPQSASSQFGTLVASQPKSNPQSEIGLKQVLADLNESLKMPLKDIASSEANTLRLLTDLNYFLSLLPLEDVALCDRFKAIIDSLHQEFPSVLCSFKQAFATTNKFALLEPHLNEVATMPVSEISKANTFTGDAQQKEATSKEKIIRLEKAITDLPIDLEAHTMSQSDVPSSQINEESEKDLAGKVPDSEIPFPTDLKQIESPAPSPLDNTLNKTHIEIKLSQIEISTDKDRKAHPKNIQDFGDEDLVKSFPDVEEDGDGQIHVTSASDVAADNLVKVLTELKESLKIPLKDIACSEANSLRLLVALNFLSNFTLEDVTLSDGLKAIIVSMHKEPKSILCSFKQVFATINKFAVLEPYLNEVATMLVPKVSTAKNFMDKAQQKEETLKEQISRLQKEIKDREADLSSLQEEKKKCIAEIKRYKEENYNVKKDESKMLEDKRKTEQEILKVHYGWSALCSQFELNRIAATNPS